MPEGGFEEFSAIPKCPATEPTYDADRDICYGQTFTANQIKGKTSREIAELCSPGSFYNPKTKRCESEPVCEGGVLDPKNDVCLKLTESPQVEQNGYLYAFFGDPKKGAVDFLTVEKYGKLFSCKKQPWKCPVTGESYNSQESCNKYCFDVSAGHRVQRTCTRAGGESILVGGNRPTLKECEKYCAVSKTTPKLKGVGVKVAFTGGAANAYGPLKIRVNGTLKGQSVSQTSLYGVDYATLGTVDAGMIKQGDKLTISFNPKLVHGGAYYATGFAHLPDNRGLDDSEKIAVSGGYCADIGKIGSANNRIKLLLDFDGDGVTDKTLDITDTYYCETTAPRSLSLTVRYENGKIRYETINSDGSKGPEKSYDIKVMDMGVCKTESTPGSQTFYSDFVLKAGPEYFNGTTTHPEKIAIRRGLQAPVAGNPNGANNADVIVNGLYDGVSKVALYSKDVSAIAGKDPTPSKDLIKQIVDGKIVPLPLSEGVEAFKKKSFLFKDFLGKDDESGKPLYFGFGHSPWNQCREYEVSKIVEETETSPKDECAWLGAGWTFNPSSRKCEKPVDKMPPVATGTLTLGREGNNYLSAGCEEFNFKTGFIVKDVSKVQEFKISYVQIDDFMNFFINDQLAYAGPYGGDRLKILGNGWTVEYGEGLTRGCDPSRTWRLYPGVDAKGHLKNGLNTARIKLVVGDLGEGYVKIDYKTVGTDTITCSAGHCANSNVKTFPPTCEKGTRVGNVCVVNPRCRAGFVDSPTAGLCQKSALVPKKYKIKICRPWWTIRRMYICNTTKTGYDSFIRNLTFGYPRWITIEKDPVTIQKSLVLDKNGNIVTPDGSAGK